MRTLPATAPLLLLLLAPACSPDLPQERSVSMVATSAVVPVDIRVVKWPAKPLLMAHLMMERYGKPEEVHADRLVWLVHWPWKRIVVSTKRPEAPLEQTVAYIVPAEKLQDLERFSRRLRVDAQRGELSFLSDREGYNRLALNLADDVVCGRKTPEQARRFFARTIRLSGAGKSSPYTTRLFFAPLPDEPRPTRMERF